MKKVLSLFIFTIFSFSYSQSDFKVVVKGLK